MPRTSFRRLRAAASLKHVQGAQRVKLRISFRRLRAAASLKRYCGASGGQGASRTFRRLRAAASLKQRLVRCYRDGEEPSAASGRRPH